MSEPRLPDRDPRDFYLPDFCAARAVLAIVLIAALLASVLALARQPMRGAFLVDLARTSAFLLWTGLLCAAVLCRARPRLATMPVRRASAWALGLIVATVALVAESAWWVGRLWEGRLGVRSGLFPAYHWGFVLPSVAIAAIVAALALRYFYVSSEWRRNVELESRARIRALQARIRPHFLFNSLNTIAALTRSDAARAEEAIEDLADLFRVSLSESRGQITLREELEVARIYQRIEQLRLGERLRVDWRVGELPPHAMVPSLLLQPLLENAIAHGIEPLPGGGTVRVAGSVEGDLISLEVTNPRAPDAAPARTGNRMALENVRQRLALAFPGRSSVEVEPAEAHYRVRIRFPFVPGEAHGPF